MFYEEFIDKALAENKLYYCILGTGEYKLESRDEMSQFQTNYDHLLLAFDLYEKKYPERKLKERYEQTLRNMLNENSRPAFIYKATNCLLTQITKEKEPEFGFRISNKEEFLQFAKESLNKNKENIIEYINNIYERMRIGENLYSSVTYDVEASLSSVGK